MPGPCCCRWWRALALAALLGLVPAPAPAHIEAGPMPDGVAEMEYKILLEFEPDNTEVRNKLGMVYYRMGKLDQAEAAFRRVLATKPDDYNAVDALGLVALQRGDTAGALAQFQKAITMNPADAMAHYHLGQAEERLGRRAAARAAYRRALELVHQQPAAPGRDARLATIRDALSRLADHDR